MKPFHSRKNMLIPPQYVGLEMGTFKSLRGRRRTKPDGALNIVGLGQSRSRRRAQGENRLTALRPRKMCATPSLKAEQWPIRNPQRLPG